MTGSSAGSWSAASWSALVARVDRWLLALVDSAVAGAEPAAPSPREPRVPLR